MQDLAIVLENRPGALAEMGEALGRAGVSIEGGGAWVVGDRGAAHFLFEDGQAARRALEAVGIQVLQVRDVIVQRLKQAVPGQLGQLTRRMAESWWSMTWPRDARCRQRGRRPDHAKKTKAPKGAFVFNQR